MKLHDFAMQMEQGGKEYYEKMRDMTPIVALQKLFSILATDEQKHYEVLKDLSTGVGTKMSDSIALEEAKTIFPTLDMDKNTIDNLRSKLDLYLHVMGMEADSIRLYEDIATKNEDPLVVSVIKRIIDEEKRHYNTLENIHDYIVANDRMMPWRDFQGVREIVK